MKIKRPVVTLIKPNTALKGPGYVCATAQRAQDIASGKLVPGDYEYVQKGWIHPDLCVYLVHEVVGPEFNEYGEVAP